MKRVLTSRPGAAAFGALLLAGAAFAQSPPLVQEFPALFGKPQGIVKGPDGKIWLVDELGNSVVQMDVNGSVLLTKPLTGNAQPQNIVAGPASSNTLWFTEPGTDKIGRISTTGTLTEMPVSAGAQPQAIALGNDGNLWFTEPGIHKVGRMTPSGQLQEFNVPLPGNKLDGIAAGPCQDQAVWLTADSNNAIIRMDAIGATTQYAPDLLIGSIPRGITAGPSGDCNLYFAARGLNKIGKIASVNGDVHLSPALADGSRPVGIVVGSDGNLYFTENGLNRIGKMTTGGILLFEYAIPTPDTFPDGIAAGPDGNIWFTEAGGDKVGRVNIGATPTPTPTPTPIPGVGPDLQISKTAEVLGEPGSRTILYRVSYANVGTRSSTGVRVQEYFPRFTSFFAGESSGGWTCNPVSEGDSAVGGGLCTRQVGLLAPGQSVTSLFAVREGQLTLGEPAGWELFNVATASDDGQNGLDQNPFDNFVFLATPDPGCSDNTDPIKYLLCLIHPPSARAPGWLGRAVAKVGQVLTQLRTYYQFRDKVVLTPGGRRWHGFYRTYSPEMRGLLETDATLRNLGIQVIASWQSPVESWIAGQGATILVTPGMANDLAAFLQRLMQLASPGLLSHLSIARIPSLAGLTLEQAARRFDQRPCAASDANLCLGGGRFRIETSWRDDKGNSGTMHAVRLTEDAGYFWFLDSSNVEVVVKALDACGYNDRFWVFAGGLTNVQVAMTVTDTVTGLVRTYVNPQGLAFHPIQDTAAFQTCGASFQSVAPKETGPAEAPLTPLPAAGQACIASPTALCLNSSRFLLQIAWEDSNGNSGQGQAVALTSEAGYFWFLNADNIEVVVKVIDACGYNQHYWVFVTGLTDLHVVMTVTDTKTGAVNTYENALKHPFEPILDTTAFQDCP